MLNRFGPVLYLWRRKKKYIPLDKVQIQNDKKYDSNNTLMWLRWEGSQEQGLFDDREELIFSTSKQMPKHFLAQ